MQDFRNLQVWQKSHELALEIYKISKSFPNHELYGIIGQIRRSMVSIPTNIAEGCGRGSDADFKRFIQIAIGSSSETEYLLLLSKDLGYINKEEYNRLNTKINEIKKMLISLILKLKN